ncbi:crossover junction endodeoxyribonuclease RuvC [Burkholderiales bacterium]|nr:crossover junction endodeoxyribonuclease RuvC [Burkholderiales bacterium]
MRVLGIDPGLRVTGFGVIDVTPQNMTYVTSGCIKTVGQGLPDRLKEIVTGVMEIIEGYTPSIAVVEQVFVNVNPQSTLLLGQARGASISAAVLKNLPVAEFTALQVKQSVVGNGHADKSQVQEMVKRLLSLPSAPSTDAADALACAICYAHSERVASRMRQATPN